MAGLLLLAGGCCHCGSGGDALAGAETRQVVHESARRQGIIDAFNARVGPLGRFKAWVNVRLRYRDDGGELREEQPEGLLQVVRPDRLGLRLGKAGKTLFWFGCDQNEYWWFDLEKTPSAAVGRRDEMTASAREELGLSVAPWELIDLLGVSLLPPDAEVEIVEVGASDPRGLEITVWAAASGKDATAPRVPLRRYVLSSPEAIPSRVELFDAAGELIAWSELSGRQAVEFKEAKGPVSAEVPGEALIRSALDQTEVRVTLTRATDAQIAEQSFELPSLLKHFDVSPDRVKRVVPREPSASDSGEGR